MITADQIIDRITRLQKAGLRPKHIRLYYYADTGWELRIVMSGMIPSGAPDKEYCCEPLPGYRVGTHNNNRYAEVLVKKAESVGFDGSVTSLAAYPDYVERLGGDKAMTDKAKRQLISACRHLGGDLQKSVRGYWGVDYIGHRFALPLDTEVHHG